MITEKLTPREILHQMCRRPVSVGYTPWQPARLHSGRLLRAAPGGLPVLVVVEHVKHSRGGFYRVFLLAPSPAGGWLHGWYMNVRRIPFGRVNLWGAGSECAALISAVTEGRAYLCSQCITVHESEGGNGFSYCAQYGVKAPATWTAAAWLAAGGGA